MSCSSGPKSFDELKEAGKISYARGNYSEARKLLNGALELNLSDRDVLFYLGLSCQKDYILDSALYFFKKADLLHPNDRDINQSIFQIALELQQNKHALKAINVLIETGDNIDKYYKIIIELNTRLKQYYVAFLTARLLYNSDMEDPSNHLLFASTAHRTDSIATALEIINNAIAKFGENEEFLVNKSIFLARLKNYVEAEKILRKLVKNSTQTDLVKLNLANVLSSQDNRSKKLEAFDLYKDIQQRLSPVYKIDSTVRALEIELNSQQLQYNPN